MHIMLLVLCLLPLGTAVYALSVGQPYSLDSGNVPRLPAHGSNYIRCYSDDPDTDTSPVHTRQTVH